MATIEPLVERRCPDVAGASCARCAEFERQNARLIDIVVEAKIDPAELERGPAVGEVEGLSTRQVQVGSLIARGWSNAEIAEVLFLGVNSIKTHLRGLYRSLGVRNRTEAALWFVRMGLVGPHEGR